MRRDEDQQACSLCSRVVRGSVSRAVLLSAPPVSAGTNGQHVKARGSGYPWGELVGTNQNGQQHRSGLRNVGPDNCFSDGTDWWKGPIRIEWYREVQGGPQYATTTYGNVPVNQGGNDWYTVR
jgi:hypothetical protein